MSKIIITRSSEWNNRLREIGLYVDGKKIGTIANGETKSFAIEPGTHSIEARIDWSSSPMVPFILGGEEDKKYFKLSGYRGSNIIAVAVLVIVVGHIIVRRTTGFEHLIWLAVIPFLIMMYYITFGRKKYLLLEEKASWE